jgi:hypothetical protein
MFMLKKITASGMDSRVVIWIREFLIDFSQRVKSREALFIRS